MTQILPFSPLKTLRRLARPSTFLRAVWLVVALFHGWLVARRLAGGEWSSFSGGVIVLLCAAGVGYASLKFWQVSTFFDGEPRRALVFALVLLFGHLAVEAPVYSPGDSQPRMEFVGALIALPAVAGLAWALAMGCMRRNLISLFTPPQPLMVAQSDPDDCVSCLQFLSPHLFRRPPPFAA